MSLKSRLRSLGKWLWPIAFVLGTIGGMYAYLLYVSRAVSYLSDDPKTCVNCHVMTPQYKTWEASSHAQVAHCNDCHVPHNSVASKYFFKAKDGLYHASVFTLRLEPQVVRARAPSQKVIQQNCLRCHAQQVNDAKLAVWVDHAQQKWEDRFCWDCHRSVPHGRVKSASSVGFNIEALPVQEKKPLNIPDWMEEALNDK